MCPIIANICVLEPVVDWCDNMYIDAYSVKHIKYTWKDGSRDSINMSSTVQLPQFTVRGIRTRDKLERLSTGQQYLFDAIRLVTNWRRPTEIYTCNQQAFSMRARKLFKVRGPYVHALHKSPLPLTDPRDAVPHAHRVEHRCRRSVG